VAFSTKASLGTSPVSSIPYSISLVSSLLSFGGWLNLLSVIQISVQVLILRKQCKPAEIIIQLILAFIYGYLTNLSCFLLKNLEVNTYLMQFTYMIYIIVAALICYIFLGRLEGVREGSIIAAFLVGTIIKGYNYLFDRLKNRGRNKNANE